MVEMALRHVYKKYDNAEKYSVTDFSLEIADREFIVFVGPSGCGKSTTLRMIAGLEDISEGELLIGDKVMNDVAPKDRDIAMVFQNYALYPHMTVKQNIIFPLQNMHISKTEALARTQKYARLVGIEELLDRKPKQLSGGQQQRVAIARALVKEPKVLLLDEPLSNLDARLRLQTREEIKRIQRETGITTVFVTHDQEEAMSISDEIVVMKSGVEQQKGRPQNVYENPINQFVAKFLGTPPINIFAGKVQDGGLYIGEERIGDSNLENQEVTVGIRPEGFEISPEGTLTINIQHIEHIGRDKSIVATNPYTEKETFRFIVDSDNNVFENTNVKVLVKSNKCYVFDKLTEKRLQ